MTLDTPRNIIIAKKTILLFANQQFCVVKNVQKRQGGNECGLYAITNATSIAFGKDSCKMSYSEPLMREHLLQCLSDGTSELFS